MDKFKFWHKHNAVIMFFLRYWIFKINWIKEYHLAIAMITIIISCTPVEVFFLSFWFYINKQLIKEKKHITIYQNVSRSYHRMNYLTSWKIAEKIKTTSWACSLETPLARSGIYTCLHGGKENGNTWWW